MRRLPVYALASALLLLAACAPVSVPEDGYCEHFHARLAYCLVAPADMVMVSERLDRVTVEYDGEHRVFIGQLAVNEREMRLAAHALTGMNLFQLAWDGQDIDYQVREASMELEPSRLIALLQLVVAPMEALEGKVHGGRVVESRWDGVRERRLQLDGGRQVMRIRFMEERVLIEFGEDTRITLTPLDEADH